METLSLYRLADKSGVSVEHFPLPENLSASVQCDDRLYVALNEHMTSAEERVCLAHELGHCETLSFYNIYSPLDVREKHERRANCWAINKLIPKTRLMAALRDGYVSIYELAEYFNVTTEFMQKAVDYYCGT